MNIPCIYSYNHSHVMLNEKLKLQNTYFKISKTNLKEIENVSYGIKYYLTEVSSGVLFLTKLKLS